MKEFEVFGPYKIEPEQYERGPRISEKSFVSLWSRRRELKEKRGIYIFGIRAAKGYAPYYVGQTKRSFGEECSQSHKITRYNDVVMSKRRTSFVMFFVAQKTGGKGRPNEKVLGEIERYFIGVARKKNPRLLNRTRVSVPTWSVDGVIRSKRGKSSKATVEFKKFMGLW